MKKLGIFVLGFIAGVISVFFISGIIPQLSGYGLQEQEKEGNCLASGFLEVFQALHPGAALAYASGSRPLLVFLRDESGKLYYDGEKVKIPAGKCARQIGVYHYKTKAENRKTIPAVVIE
ncbi:MAG: hypothetical protein NC211_08820 [Alistipes senegalensis]|nr:hypothetical protein [Oxalobacter formigenes]MCM1281909.1 hypothetical protein [Alistipes senegalensis]